MGARSGTSGPLLTDYPLWTCSAVRFQILILIASAMAVFAAIRGSLSMALVCMVEQPFNSTYTKSMSPYKINWSVENQAKIHTSFYAGALVSVFVAGNLIGRFGAKKIMSLGILLNVVGTLAIPFAVIFLNSYYYVMFLRFIMGLGSGFVIPCGSVMIARWFPISEKSTAMAIFTTGNQVGIAVSMGATAKFCEFEGMIGGWPLAFFSYGLIGFVFLLFWLLFATDKPRNSKYITASELEYIVGKREKRKRTNTIMLPTPYKKIFMSACVTAICVCSFAQSFIIVGLITYLPAYYQSALQMSISKNGIWSTVPFCLQMVTKILFGTVADKLKKRGKSASAITKWCNAIASFGTATSILLISLLGAEDSLLIMLLMTASMGMLSGYVAGYNTSIVTVAPQFTAFVSSYSQIYSQAASTIAPYLLGYMTTKGTIDEWELVFYLLAVVLIVSGIVFQFLGHGHSESWGEVASANPSLRLSMASMNISSGASSSETPNVHKSSNIDDLNAKLLAEEKPLPKRPQRVSYASVSFREDDTMVQIRSEELENDCIIDKVEAVDNH
ncbi:unnamed protein product [Auanema sp. JU1783]|nr:unnamed protein product [Auanema sp. JU1783]